MTSHPAIWGKKQRMIPRLIGNIVTCTLGPLTFGVYFRNQRQISIPGFYDYLPISSIVITREERSAVRSSNPPQGSASRSRAKSQSFLRKSHSLHRCVTISSIVARSAPCRCFFSPDSCRPDCINRFTTTAPLHRSSSFLPCL